MHRTRGNGKRMHGNAEFVNAGVGYFHIKLFCRIAL